MSKLLTFVVVCMSILPQSSFRDSQRQHKRVDTAYIEKESTVKGYFTAKNINDRNFTLFLRAFKKEMKLEAWVKPRTSDTFVLLHTFDFCSTSGMAGPKRKEGDLQIPEGIYSINHFNPVSDFHLSLGINYPNASDKILSDQRAPGSAIYIHGNCVTVGCIPITDDKIKELYILAVEARNDGQEKIPVHIFPTMLTDLNLNELSRDVNASPTLIGFWKNLQLIFNDFENSRKLKDVRVNSKGSYIF
jgi:murein L,D-transpeptidase YafK